jgi:hypothetical protein
LEIKKHNSIAASTRRTFPREAYYAGWEIVGQLLRSGMSSHEVATAPAARFPDLMERAISSLEASFDRQSGYCGRLAT